MQWANSPSVLQQNLSTKHYRETTADKMLLTSFISNFLNTVRVPLATSLTHLALSLSVSQAVFVSLGGAPNPTHSNIHPIDPKKATNAAKERKEMLAGRCRGFQGLNIQIEFFPPACPLNDRMLMGRCGIAAHWIVVPVVCIIIIIRPEEVFGRSRQWIIIILLLSCGLNDAGSWNRRMTRYSI